MPDRRAARTLLPLETIARPDEAERRLLAGGLSGPAARRQAEVASRCALHLLRAGEAPTAPALALHVPGRIEVLGKHTDYCGGRSLLAATDRGFAFVAVGRRDGLVEIADVVQELTDSFAISRDLTTAPGPWTNYPRTVARRVARNFPGAFAGCRIAFGSTLPDSAGLSTSSAFLVGTFLVLAELEDLAARPGYRESLPDPERLAAYVASVENGSSFGPLAGDSGVGTQGGSEDHTAILASRPGELSVYSFAPVRLERRVRFPEGWSLAVASSGIEARKTGGALGLYNRASSLARAVVEVWNGATGASAPHIAGAVAGAPERVSELREVLRRSAHDRFSPEELVDRLDHFHEESERIVPEAVRRLSEGDLPGFGAAVDRSQERGARLLRNQVPETERLAADARRLGAVAASAFGAGFGGSVWALVADRDVEGFLESWRATYAQAYPERISAATFFATGAAPAAFGLGGTPAVNTSPAPAPPR